MCSSDLTRRPASETNSGRSSGISLSAHPHRGIHPTCEVSVTPNKKSPESVSSRASRVVRFLESASCSIRRYEPGRPARGLVLGQPQQPQTPGQPQQPQNATQTQAQQAAQNLKTKQDLTTNLSSLKTTVDPNMNIQKTVQALQKEIGRAHV